MLFTPLHHAARKGFTEIAEYLLSQGVDVNIRRSLSPCSSFVFSSISLSLSLWIPIRELLSMHVCFTFISLFLTPCKSVARVSDC